MFNRKNNKYLSSFDQPRLFNLSANYTVPRAQLGSSAALKGLAFAMSNWTLGAFVAYSSGLPIQAPAAQNQLAALLFRGTFANRVPGQPVFKQDLNCHCFDPNKEFVLNRDAWSDPAQGTWGTSAAYYSDYRFQRRPVENLAFGRTFNFGGDRHMNINIRAEFNNIFNRTYMNNPVVPNAGATQTLTNGRPTAGFGWINTASVQSAPRNGTIVGRFTF